MKKSLVLVVVLGMFMVGCSTTELVDSQPLNPPFPVLASSVGDGSGVNLIAESDATLTAASSPDCAGCRVNLFWNQRFIGSRKIESATLPTPEFLDIEKGLGEKRDNEHQSPGSEAHDGQIGCYHQMAAASSKFGC